MEVNVTEEGLRYKAVQRIACTASLHGEYFFYPVTAVNIILAITACLENAVILVALQRRNSLHPSSKLMFQCLAVTDLCVGVIAQPLFVIQFASASHNQFQLCFAILSINDVVGSCLSGVSLLTLAAISVDRLLALMLRLRYRHVVTLKRVRIVVVSLWFSIIVIVIIYHYIFSVSDFVVGTILLLCVIISSCSYTKIYFTLRKHQAQLHSHQTQPKEESSGQSKRSIPLNIARYRKSVSSALWVQMTLLACYLPFGVVIAVSAFTRLATPSFELAWETTIVIILLNSSLSPFIYCWKIKEIRLAGKETLRQLCCCLR